MCGVMGIAPRGVAGVALHGVAGIALYGVAGITLHGVAGVVPCSAMGIALHVVSWSWSLHHGVVVMVAVVMPHCVAVTVIVPRGAAVAITILVVIMVRGWAVVGPGRRGQLHIHQQGGEHGDWIAKEEISRKKKKEKKEKHTSRG